VDEIFGVSITSIMNVLLVMLGLCLLTVAWVAVRRPVVFKMGVRNIPRRPTQTALIVVGLMLSTLIMAAAFGVGDTFDHSLKKDVYDLLGPVDEVVVADPDGDGEGDAEAAFGATIPASALTAVDAAVGDDPAVDGVVPVLLAQVPVQNEAKGQGEPVAFLAGVDPARLGEVGGLADGDGGEIDLGALAEGEVVIAAATADALDAEVGDTLTLAYANAPFELRVAAIGEESIFAGQLNSSALGLAMPLDGLRRITNQPDALSLIAVSNAGDDAAGVDGTDAVVAKLEPLLAGQELGVNAIKQDNLDGAELASSAFTGLFLVLGLFSIAAGILLIVLIFTMLAAERRPEMGMARAVGARRSQLFQQFVAEGTGYALPAGVVGAGLGVGATFVMAYVLRSLFGDVFPIEASVAPRSLVVAFCLGVVITFLAVTVASWRISRLNVVAAVRNIPETSNPTRKRRTLVWGVVLALAGAGLIVLSQDVRQLALFSAGISLVPFGVALVLRYFGVPSRAVFTTVGLFLLLYWLLPEQTSERLFGAYDANFEMFFVSGIFMVLAATIVIVNNLDLLLASLGRPLGSVVGGAVGLAVGLVLWRSDASGIAGELIELAAQVVLGVGGVLLLFGVVGLLLGLFPGVAVPAVRTAIAYPGADRGRTGMTIAMFSLIVFSLVMMATMSENLTALFLGEDANAGWHVQANAGDANPIADFDEALQARGVDTGRFAAQGVVTTPDVASRLRLVGGEFLPYAVNGADAAWLDHTPLVFQQRAEGYADDAAIREALRGDPTVAVIDASAIPGQGDPEGFTLEGFDTDADSFAPIAVEVEDPDGQPVPLTIIGVIDQGLGSLFGLYGAREAIDPIYPRVDRTSYFVALDNPDAADEVAKEIEAALLPNGVQAVSIQEELEEAQGLFRGVFALIQGFLGLGLVVGVAAIGVIAFRSVVERRQQIGVLRALGFQRSLISLSFLIETAFIVLLGLVSGSLLGLALARYLVTSEDFGVDPADFLVPYPIIVGVLAATLVVALLMAWVPARQAASVTPAEALRYE
jgi:putative ABC transport system permease protein